MEHCNIDSRSLLEKWYFPNFLTESQLKSIETPVKPVGSLSFAAEQAAISLKPAGGFDYKSTTFDG